MWTILEFRAFVRKISVRSLFSSHIRCRMDKHEDNRLDRFRRICDAIAEERSYLNKVKILQDFFKTGSDGFGFKGNTLLWVQMLIPSASQRIYNLQNKQMLKLFSRIFGSDLQQMHLDLEQEGDVSETLRKFFESSPKLKPQANSTLYLQDVEEFLVKLEQKTKEDEQAQLLKELCRQGTALDLKTVIRLIKQDLRINAGARHILDAFGPDAYPAYQSSRDLKAVVEQYALHIGDSVTAKPAAKQKAAAKVGQVQVMIPISPMLACACKSVDEALAKNPSGLFSEVKYDGERVQIHKKGQEFKYFSRNLKPVMDHKIKRFKEFIPKAFPGAGDMILDSEIILVDTKTGELLPFGSLGAHKKKEYANAEVCLFVFDCLLLNGEDMTSKSFRERRRLLEENITPMESYVQLSECQFLKTKSELALMTAKVLKANLEGVVLKNPLGTYQPGKRGWLKVKKDYLFGGQMADTADLVVLGAWFGSGKKGGLLSIFLMGCYDPRDKLWKTVTKVHSGLDDATMEETHERLMKVMERSNPNKLPNWLLCKKALIPDYLAKSPQQMPVWEITGAEFTKSEAHTASGISIRFPRITKIRDDKSAQEANDLTYLENMFEASKRTVNVDLLMANCDSSSEVPVNGKLNTDAKMSTSPNSTPHKNRKRLSNESEKSPSHSVKKVKNTDNREESELTNCKSPKHKPPNIFDLSTRNTANPNLKVTKSQSNFETSRDSHSKSKAKVESDLLLNIVAYFTSSVDKSQYETLLLAHGGVVTADPKEAQLIFYESDQSAVDLEQCRNLYERSSRHLSVKWLSDSVEQKKQLPYAVYAVVLN